MSSAIDFADSDLQGFQNDVGRLKEALEGTIVGQQPLINDLVTAVLAGGHVLLEGVPGLGKTYLAKALARSIGVALARVQCTPDLMPSDITGSEILVQSGAGDDRCFEFRPGPIFSSIVLVDEINRATPKTQAAFLEAMQEGQVTYGGVRHELPSPFWVLATQNPIELEGTYPLPEAQLDRFLFKIVVGYPSREAMLTMIDRSLDSEPADHVETVVPTKRIGEMMQLVREVVIADRVRQAAVDLVLATHPGRSEGNAQAHSHFRYGASPRALQSLLRAARVSALAEGRAHVATRDLVTNALPALRHRVLLKIESELENVDVDEVLGEIIAAWQEKTDRS